MKLYKDGTDISGGSFELTDIATMILQLDDECIGMLLPLSYAQIKELWTLLWVCTVCLRQAYMVE